MNLTQTAVTQSMEKLLGIDDGVLVGAFSEVEDGTFKGGTIAGFDIGMLIALLEILGPFIESMIQNCDANRRRLNRLMRNPRPWQRGTFRRRLTDAINQGPPEWKSEAYEIGTVMLAQAADTSENDMAAIIDECKGAGSWE